MDNRETIALMIALLCSAGVITDKEALAMVGKYNVMSVGREIGEQYFNNLLRETKT